ncbi:MAG: PGPGW domain-containing protein [Nocardioidaceae bacterium]
MSSGEVRVPRRSVGGGEQASRYPGAIRRAAHRFRAWIRRNAVLNTTWRVTVFVVGMIVVLAGLIMLVAPGPGWLGIIAGFAILATEFVWARHALYRARDAAFATKQKAFDPRTRWRNQIIAVVVGVLFVAACIAYYVFYGFTVPWKIDWLRQLP